MMGGLRPVIEPGFLASEPVRVALVVGAVVAVVSGVVGVFTVVRGQSFGGHALTDVSTAGGSGALLLGLSPLTGFVAGGIVGAGAMESIGVERVRGRDLATGIVLGAATGLAALFLYLDTTTSATTGATQQILFGSIFVIDTSTIPYVIGRRRAGRGPPRRLYRPLLLASVDTDIARARGVPVRMVGQRSSCWPWPLSVGLSSLAIGTILSTALLIGPAGHRAAAHAADGCGRSWWPSVIGVLATWIGMLLSYDSYYWGSSQNGWPVSFFIVAVDLRGLPGLGVVRRPGPGRTRQRRCRRAPRRA